MLRKGDEYRDSIRDGREVWVDGERVKDVPTFTKIRYFINLFFL